MRIGAISDVHANLPALETVLKDMPPVDRIVCAGDVVGYYSWPSECVETIREREIPCVQGNHDRVAASGDAAGFNHMARAGVRWARERLTPEQLEWLDALPTQRQLADERVKIVHGHPDDPDRYTYPMDVSADMLGGEDVLICGHTHVQHVAEYPGGVVVNPGSVGQPRDGDPRAAYALIDLDEQDVKPRRVAYDIEAVREAVAEAGLPARVGERLRAGR